MIAVQALTPLIALALERRFDAGTATIGRALGIATLASSLGSLPVAGMRDRALRRRLGLAARPAVIGFGAAAAIACAALLLVADGVGAALLAIALFLFATCIFIALTALPALIVSVLCAIRAAGRLRREGVR